MDYADLADAEIENTLQKCIMKASSDVIEPKSTRCKNCQEVLIEDSLDHFCDTDCLKDFERRQRMKSITGK